jgi:hypothetical protein
VVRNKIRVNVIAQQSGDRASVRLTAPRIVTIGGRGPRRKAFLAGLKSKPVALHPLFADFARAAKEVSRLV